MLVLGFFYRTFSCDYVMIFQIVISVFRHQKGNVFNASILTTSIYVFNGRTLFVPSGIPVYNFFSKILWQTIVKHIYFLLFINSSTLWASSFSVKAHTAISAIIGLTGLTKIDSEGIIDIDDKKWITYII